MESRKKAANKSNTLLTPAVVKAWEAVLQEEGNALLCSEEELLLLLNDKLPAAKRIDMRTFRRLRSGKAKDTGAIFRKALIRERRSLFEKLENEGSNWRKWAWIMEVKFDEWSPEARKGRKAGEKSPGSTIVNLPPNGRD